MNNQYTYHRLREIYSKIGGEDSGRIYHEFFRAIDNNELSENQALIKLATELAERDLQTHEHSMQKAELIERRKANPMIVHIVQIYNPAQKEFYINIMKQSTYDNWMKFMQRKNADKFTEIIKTIELTQEEASKIKADL